MILEILQIILLQSIVLHLSCHFCEMDFAVWVMQNKISALFGTQRPAVTKHLHNIFKSGELDEFSVSSILEHTAA